MNYVVTPETEIDLFIMDLQIDQKNQLTFTSLEAQKSYFDGLEHIKIDNSTFQRNDYTCRVELPFEEAIKYTYCRYKNNDKWYFAFITDVTYSNSNMSVFQLVTDVWQTYMFDVNLGICFIDRETVDNDSIGLHTFPEGLETGEYVVNSTNFAMTSPYAWGSNGYYICLEATRDPNSAPSYIETIGGVSGGLPSAIGKFLYNGDEEGLNLMKQDIQGIMNISSENEGAIHNVYSVHPLAMGYKTSTKIVNRLYLNSVEPRGTDFNVSYQQAFSNNGISYTPKNNKLLTFPYVYYALSNGGGEMVTLRQEDFLNYNFQSRIYGVVCAGNNIRLFPYNYKNTGNTNNTRRGYNPEGITLGKMPVLNWAGDTYTAWLVNNGLSQRSTIGKMQNNVLRNQLNNGGSAISFNPLNWLRAGTTGVGEIETLKGDIAITEQEQLHQRELADLVPPSVGGNGNAGDINMVTGHTDFCVYCMGIKPEYAKKIDGYFYKYGYKVSETKQIKINTRAKFNYIKTVGAIITGDIPQMFLETIKSMFDNGVTFWHSPYSFMKYSENYNDNPIK